MTKKAEGRRQKAEPTEHAFGSHEDYGVMQIAAERERQILSEGYGPTHDDNHLNGEIAMAAACYACLGWVHSSYKHTKASEMEPPNRFPLFWPWANQYWKPKDDPIRNLARAGALIAAEIDRLSRLQNKEAK